MHCTFVYKLSSTPKSKVLKILDIYLKMSWFRLFEDWSCYLSENMGCYGFGLSKFIVLLF